ncbi:SWI SNF, matrix associated, actin dependent regulator of chromatin, sub b, member 1 [Boothiomyces macroporosus]|uniref:SWI SNF, matrix associated, actin dependent regulator of chromatin, sub b, member 1 n=1 Tax=Boothiomyces macroporosus TaxID=261099 RepID=A0AAD5UDH0_9FUNG|nr:SWI SNF, matrix associated, actin dependent regulator of chromatin, sub b, member 1 [Boothiomyces macroporosus]
MNRLRRFTTRSPKLQKTPAQAKFDQTKENLASKLKESEKGFFTRLEDRFEEKRLKAEEEALAKGKRLTPEMKKMADKFFDAKENQIQREKLVKEALYEGYFDNAKEIALKGAKLWEAPQYMRPVQISPKIADLKGQTFDGTDISLWKLVPQAKASLISFHFNQFGEPHVASFLEPFIKEFGGDERVKVLEINVVEQVIKSPILKFVTPYLKWKMAADRKKRYMILNQSIVEQRRTMGMHNNALGWVNLVDSAGNIRWQAHGIATLGELDTLIKSTRKLCEAAPKKNVPMNMQPSTPYMKMGINPNAQRSFATPTPQYMQRPMGVQPGSVDMQAYQKMMQNQSTPNLQNSPAYQLQQAQMMRAMQYQRQQMMGQQRIQVPGKMVQGTPMNPNPLKRPITLPNLSQIPRPNTILPALNTYAPRMKRGHTALVAPNVVEQKPKRNKFVEEASDEDEEFIASDEDDSEEEGGRTLRSRVREANTPVQAPEPALPPEAAAFELKKRRMLSTTKHDFEKINMYRLENFAGVQEVLVPIKIELEVDGYKIVDQFTWNLNEQVISTDKFAEYFCDDLDLNPQVYIPTVSRSIRSQIEEYKLYYQVQDAPVPEDTRIVIRLDINVGKVHLRDRFEWDLASTLNPEDFATNLVADLRLGGEFISLISHSIREQIHQFKQNGDFDSTFAIEKPFRSEEEAMSWAPFVDCGDQEETEEFTIEQDRKARLLRRQLRLNQQTKRKPYDYRPNSQHIQLLPPNVRETWRCSWCKCTAMKTTGFRDGPDGELTLCKSCGSYYETNQELPTHRHMMFK